MKLKEDSKIVEALSGVLTIYIKFSIYIRSFILRISTMSPLCHEFAGIHSLYFHVII